MQNVTKINIAFYILHCDIINIIHPRSSVAKKYNVNVTLNSVNVQGSNPIGNE